MDFFGQKKNHAEEHFIPFLKCDEAAAVMGSHIMGANEAGSLTQRVLKGRALCCSYMKIDD